MKIYNPLLGGETIKFKDNTIFSKDYIMTFSEERGRELLSEYSFLVNMDDESKSPDACEDTRNIPMKEWYSGRATARLTDELNSVTTGISKAVIEVKDSIEQSMNSDRVDFSNVIERIDMVNGSMENIAQILSRSQEINMRILEELVNQRESKFSFKKLFKR